MKHKALPMKAVAGEKGIYRRGKKYLAKAYVNGVEVSAGTFSTLAEAKKARLLKIASMHRDFERGRPLTYDKNTTFEQWATDWLRRRGTATNSNAYEASTLRAVTTHLNKHLLPVFGPHRLHKITPSVVDAGFELVAIGCSPKYRRNVFQTLGLILREAFRQRVIAFDPTENLPLPKVRTNQIEVPSPDLVRRVLDEMTSPWKDVALLAVSSGLREGELLALQWTDIDVVRKRIRVNKARDQAGAEKAPKTARSIRHVSVTEETIDALLAYRERTRAEREKALTDAEERLRQDKPPVVYARTMADGSMRTITPAKRSRQRARNSVRAKKARRLIEFLRAPHWDVYVFAARVMPARKTGRMPVLDARNLLRELHRAAAVVGVKLRFHDLRHVFASVVLQLGGDSALKFVQKNLGHKKASFTLDVYSHLLPDRADVFLAPINALFHPGPHNAPHTTERPEETTHEAASISAAIEGYESEPS
jgi:integrase